MAKEAMIPIKNRFLVLIEKMAEARKLTVEEFADLFHYTPAGVQFLREHYWFNPSEAVVEIIYDEVELTVREGEKLEKLCDQSIDRAKAESMYELIQMFDLLPEEHATLVIEMARRRTELLYCFEQPDSPDNRGGPEGFMDDFE
jgi:hypothetical protein